MKRPRVGFVGVGSIGSQRMASIAADDVVDAVAVADPSPDALAHANSLAPAARRYPSLESMLAGESLAGAGLATPSASHAEQAITALLRGVAVFSQRSLGRTAAETAAVVDYARRTDRLLGLCLSFRHSTAARRVRDLVRSG